MKNYDLEIRGKLNNRRGLEFEDFAEEIGIRCDDVTVSISNFIVCLSFTEQAENIRDLFKFFNHKLDLINKTGMFNVVSINIIGEFENESNW